MSASNPLKRLTELGQSVWYDYIRRDLITSGELAKLIREDGLAGIKVGPGSPEARRFRAVTSTWRPR